MNRLTLRVHDDLLELLQLRSGEASRSRSSFVETLLVAWLRADPRNPKVARNGKIDRDAPEPRAVRTADPVRFAERWTRYAQAHEIVMGHPPPREYLDDLDAYWPTGAEHPDDYDEQEEDIEERPAPRKR
ncbi:hypothetical protein ACQR1I_09225 [Bradyrhizobium sp. HKCCYLS2038]|uniref:hypothetical protein n=1 Tax=unclassified Bradyrhizobium TaxID=2631580 RepID=UPI003EB738B3